MVIQGKEKVTASLEYEGTSKENVAAVENALMKALSQLNDESIN